MSVRDYFMAAADHADELLRRPYLVGGKGHPLYLNKASHLATRALTRAMVTEGGELRLNQDLAKRAREMMKGWRPDYQNDVPGRLRWFAGEAERWSS